jgi:hypothetical protein
MDTKSRAVGTEVCVPKWAFADILLPCPGAIVEFYCADGQRVLSGLYRNGGFSEIASGDFYTAAHILCWRNTPRARMGSIG